MASEKTILNSVLLPVRKRSLQALVALLCVCNTVRAATIYVSPGGNDANTGANWQAAKQTVQGAVDVAVPGDTVIVTNGIYGLGSAVNITNALQLLSVNGAGVTILDAQHSSRCVTVGNNGAVAALVSGFTLRNGRAVVGGGAYCNGGTIQNCVLTGNQVMGDDANDGQGGGVYVAYGTLSNCVICFNSAQSTNAYQTAWGGGVDCNGGLLENCVVSNNLCNAEYANGGGAALNGGTMKNCRVSANSGIALSYASGGGIYAEMASFIEACVLTNNSVTTTDTYIYTAAASDGGGLYQGNGTVVRSTLICGNAAESLAGFTSGGGVWTSGSSIENCTIANNRATTQNGNAGAGGGVTWGYSDQCYNNIIRLNSADNGADNGEVNNLSYPMFLNSDIGPFVPATNSVNCISTDPLFVNSAKGDYRLQAGSLCVNSGTNMAWMTGALDLNGDTRISAGTVDMGAYEYIATPLSPALSSPARLSANQFQFVLSGTAGQTYTVEYSLTLTNWLSLLVTNAPGNPFIITDSTATNQLRFYRVRAGP